MSRRPILLCQQLGNFYVVLLVYVDDMLIGEDRIQEINRLKKQISNEFANKISMHKVSFKKKLKL